MSKISFHQPVAEFVDHRRLAEEMELYFIDEQIGAGLPVWLPNGVAIRDALEVFVKESERLDGYQRVVSPHIGKSDLYEASGHLSHYEKEMFPPLHLEDGDRPAKFYLKPMNCPHHHKVFASRPRSFRQLPLRLAEYGQVYRHEPSGSLRGLSRVRGLCQNDAHIYLDPKDALAEVIRVLDLHERCYRELGLSRYRYRLSKHDPARSSEFAGNREIWFEAEEILRQALIEKGVSYFESVGEAAFYGPKIDIQMPMGESEVDESISSVQLDFVSAARFDLKFAASSGELREPWIIHRAPLGSHERFVAMLLEFYRGRLPSWLSPIQVYLIPVSDHEKDFVVELASELLGRGVRVKIDDRQGSLSKRLHFAHRLRPFSKIIVGRREREGAPLKIDMVSGEVVSNFVLRAEIVSFLENLLRPPLCRA